MLTTVSLVTITSLGTAIFSLVIRTFSKGEKERYIHLNAEFQRIARRDKKAFLSDQCKEIKENIRMEKIRDLFKKIRELRENSMQRWAQ